MNINLKYLKTLSGLNFSKDELLFLFKATILLTIWLIINSWAFIDEYIMYSMKAQSIFIMNTLGGQGFDATKVYSSNADPRFFLVCPNVLLKISKSCTGTSLLYLYAAFIAIFPQKNLKKKLLYLILGLIIIHEYNVIRIVILSLSLKYKPEWYNFFHIYVFQTLIYVILFLLIRYYLNSNYLLNKLKHESSIQ